MLFVNRRAKVAKERQGTQISRLVNPTQSQGKIDNTRDSNEGWPTRCGPTVFLLCVPHLPDSRRKPGPKSPRTAHPRGHTNPSKSTTTMPKTTSKQLPTSSLRLLVHPYHLIRLHSSDDDVVLDLSNHIIRFSKPRGTPAVPGATGPPAAARPRHVSPTQQPSVSPGKEEAPPPNLASGGR